MTFRQKSLWSFDVNQIFKQNMKALHKLFLKYQKQGKNYIKLDKVLKLVIEDAGIDVSAEDVVYGFGMSKIPIANGHFDDNKRYLKIQLFEFLEFIGRIAFI